MQARYFPNYLTSQVDLTERANISPCSREHSAQGKRSHGAEKANAQGSAEGTIMCTQAAGNRARNGFNNKR